MHRMNMLTLMLMCLFENCLVTENVIVGGRGKENVNVFFGKNDDPDNI